MKYYHLLFFLILSFWVSPTVFVLADTEYNWGYSEGIIRLDNAQGKTGYLDSLGNVIVPFTYDTGYNYSENVAWVLKNGKWGAIDSKGKIILPFTYLTKGSQFKYGLSIVRQGDFYGAVDKTGKTVIPHRYTMLEQLVSVHDNITEAVFVASLEGKYGMLDKSGRIILPMEYDSIGCWTDSEGFLTVTKDHKYGFVSQTGEIVIPCEYDYVKGFLEDVAVVSKNGKYGFINAKNELVIDYMDYFPTSFHEGMAKVVKNGSHTQILLDGNYECGYIDKTGRLMIPIEYSSGNDFHNGVACVKKGNFYGVINRHNTVIVPFTYDRAEYFSNSDYIALEKNKTQIYVDSQGKPTPNPYYSNLQTMEDKFYLYSHKLKKAGLLDKDGKLFFPLLCDDIRYYGGTVVIGLNGTKRQVYQVPYSLSPVLDSTQGQQKSFRFDTDTITITPPSGGSYSVQTAQETPSPNNQYRFTDSTTVNELISTALSEPYKSMNEKSTSDMDKKWVINFHNGTLLILEEDRKSGVLVTLEEGKKSDVLVTLEEDKKSDSLSHSAAESPLFSIPSDLNHYIGVLFGLITATDTQTTVEPQTENTVIPDESQLITIPDF